MSSHDGVYELVSSCCKDNPMVANVSKREDVPKTHAIEPVFELVSSCGKDDQMLVNTRKLKEMIEEAKLSRNKAIYDRR